MYIFNWKSIIKLIRFIYFSKVEALAIYLTMHNWMGEHEEN